MRLAQRAGANDASRFTATAGTFIATALALFRHWFPMIPLPATAPRKSDLRSQEEAGQSGSAYSVRSIMPISREQAWPASQP